MSFIVRSKQWYSGVALQKGHGGAPADEAAGNTDKTRLEECRRQLNF
jgi:hypothetical protein